MIDDRTRELAGGANYAVFSSVLPSGWPQTHMMWVDADDEHIMVNTEVHRQKFKNIGRNPKVTVLIMETGNPWGWSEVRGTVVDTVCDRPRGTSSHRPARQEVPRQGRISEPDSIRPRDRQDQTGEDHCAMTATRRKPCARGTALDRVAHRGSSIDCRASHEHRTPRRTRS